MKQILFILATLMPAFSCMAQDWNLEKCISYALANNRELISSQYNTNIQNTERKSAQSKLLPEIKANASLEYYWKVPVQTLPGELIGEVPGTFITVPTSTNYSGSCSLDMHLNIIDVEIWSNIKLSLLKEQASKIKQASLEKVLIRNITMAYYLAQHNTENVNTAKQRYDNHQHIHHLVKQLFEKGIIDKIEYNQSLSLLKNQKSFLEQVHNVFENSLLDLKFWMGYPIDSIMTISTNYDIPSPNLSPFDASILPDYNFQRTKMKIAEREYKHTISSFHPKLSLIGSYGQLGFGDNRNFISKSSSWHTSSFIGLQISISVFSLSKSFNLKRGKALYMQAELDFSNYQEEQRKIYMQKAKSLHTNWNVYNLQSEKLHLAEENEQLSIQKIEKGIIDMLQLKQVQQDLFEEQEKYSQAKTNYLKSYVEVIYLQNK